MEASDLLQRLQQYGLDEGECTFYYHLCRLGPSRAAAVAEAAGSKRTDAYRILDHLVEKGFAEKTVERPARYLPRAVDDALDRAMAARRGQTEALEAQRTILVQSWPRPVSKAEPSRPRFTVHQGSAQVGGLLLRMIAAAKEEILFATSSDGLSRLDVAALAGALRERAGAGITVRVLAKRARAGDLPLPGIPGVRIRYGDLPTFYQALLVDDREVGLFVAAGKAVSGAEETVLCLTSSDVVLAQKALFDQAWTQAISPADLVAHPSGRQVQVLRGRWVRGARLREMVLGAKASIAIQASGAEAAGWKAQGILDALSRRAAQGLHVVLRIPADDPVPAVAGAQVESAPAGTRNLVAVVDGAQTLLGLGFAQAGEAAEAEDEWSIWSTHVDLVEALGKPWQEGGAPVQAVRRPRTHSLP